MPWVFPFPGDSDGDGRDDVAVFRSGIWQVRYAYDRAMANFTFGSVAATVAVAGD